jgi:hypothetical protein
VNRLLCEKVQSSETTGLPVSQRANSDNFISYPGRIIYNELRAFLKVFGRVDASNLGLAAQELNETKSVNSSAEGQDSTLT